MNRRQRRSFCDIYIIQIDALLTVLQPETVCAPQKPHTGDLAKKYVPTDRRPLRSHLQQWSLQTQLPANGDAADAKRPKDRGTDADFSVSVWLALLLCLRLAFSYIILQRKEAQITGKANTDLWSMHTSLRTCSCCMYCMYCTAHFYLGSDFIIRLNTQFQGCLCGWHSVFVREQRVSIFY